MMDFLSQKKFSPRLILIALLVGTIFVLVCSPFIGANALSLDNIFAFEKETIDFKVFWQMRIPRTLVAFLAGGILAVSGMVFQAMFRNPLVDPSTLGVSAGASFGATLYIWVGISFHLLGMSGISLFAFSGAALSIFIVWSLARVRYGSPTVKMLLAGIVVSFFFISLVMFIQYLSDISESFRITRWLMGGLFVFGFEPLMEILPFAIIGLVAIWYFSYELNLFTTGEELAISRGVDVDLMIKILFVLISFIVGGVVSVCGPIAFVGIIAPHMSRMLIGSDHRYLTPATFLFGGCFLTICDALARTLAAPAEVPVGVITALLGGPFFLWLLHKRFSG